MARLLTDLNSSLPKFDNVIFDLEGTLFFSDTFRSLVTDLAVKSLADAKQTSEEAAEKIMRETRETLTAKLTFDAPLTLVLLKLGVSLDKFDELQLSLDLSLCLQPDADIIQLIDSLSKKTSIIISTNMTPHLAAKVLDFLGFGSYGLQLITPQTYGECKPSRILYEKLIAEFSLDPNRTLAIGDRFDVDLAPALAVGCYAFLVHIRNDLIYVIRRLLEDKPAVREVP